MLLILFFLILIFIAIISLKIRINVKDIQISNINEKREKAKLRHKFCIYFEFFIFKYLRIIKLKFDNQKIEKIFRNITQKINDIDLEREIKKEIKNWKTIITTFKNLRLRLKKLNFNLEIGTAGIPSTVGIFTTISTAVPILIRNNASKVQYNISPIYNTGNVINFWVNCITDAYLVHIIYALYIMKMKGRKENVRRNRKVKTSNRRSYDYSNG